MSANQRQELAAFTGKENKSGLHSREELMEVLKVKVYKYNSREERERLDELGCRLSEERLLSNTCTGELIELYDRYNDGESLDSIIACIKHPGM